MRRASLYNTFSASLLLVCNACLSSCVSQIPLTKEKPVNNSTYQVEYLFEHEGCTVTPCFIKIAFALARRSAESGSTPFSL